MNRFNGDLLDGREDRINPNFGVLLFVTNGVTSSYHAVTSEMRRDFSGGFSLQANYRWSRWLDTSSDTSTGQFQDNSEPGKGAQDITCLRCERAPRSSTFRTVSPRAGVAPPGFDGRDDWWRRGARAGRCRPSSPRSRGGRSRSGTARLRRRAATTTPTAAAARSAAASTIGRTPQRRRRRRPLQPGGFPERAVSASAFPAPPPGPTARSAAIHFAGRATSTLDVSLARVFGARRHRQLQLRIDVTMRSTR